jgi:hypothetical protein
LSIFIGIASVKQSIFFARRLVAAVKVNMSTKGTRHVDAVIRGEITLAVYPETLACPWLVGLETATQYTAYDNPAGCAYN